MRRMRLLVPGAMALCLAIPGISPASPPPFDDNNVSVTSVPEGLGSASADLASGVLSVDTTVGDDETFRLYTDGREWSRATASVGRSISFLPINVSRFDISVLVDVPQGEDAPWAVANPDIPNTTLSSDAGVQIRAEVTVLSCSIPPGGTEADTVCRTPAGDSDPGTQPPTTTVDIACADVATTIEDPSGRLLMTCSHRGLAQVSFEFPNVRPMSRPTTSHTWTTSYIIVDVELSSSADTGLPGGYSASAGGTVTVSDISIVDDTPYPTT